MKKRYSLRNIRDRQVYTTREASKALGVHLGTVQGWVRAGVETVENSRLFTGRALKSFLQTQADKRRFAIGPSEFPCLRCRKGVVPLEVQRVDLNKAMGIGKRAIQLKGNCPVCGGKVNRFAYEFSADKDKNQGGSQEINTGL